MELSNYIKSRYDGDFKKFVTGEVNNASQQNHIREIVNIKEYLGKNKHAIKQRPDEVFNGVTLKTERIGLQYAKLIIRFGVNFLLGKPVSLSGSEDVIKELNKVYKKGKYRKVDYRILNDLERYGESFEYLYIKDNTIKSQVIDPSEAYPVYDENGDMIAFIQYYHVDYVDYYTIFTEDIVYQLNNSQGEDLNLVEKSINLTGMPIHYKTENEIDSTRGYAFINDIIDILDGMESLLSKSFDGYYRHIMGTPVVVGQSLTNAELPKHGNGVGYRLDDDGDFKYVTNPFGHDSFKTLYSTLRNALMDISQMPNVVLNGSTTISNVGEVAIESIFALAKVKADMMSKYLTDGFEQRLERIKTLLAIQGIELEDNELDNVSFVYNVSMPKSDESVMNVIEKLRELDAISIEGIQDNISFIDKVAEQERLAKENTDNSIEE
ncbi:phage portal protein [Oceanobacillus kimchii]|uniref:phage portal protein n=1 Tax=Oceanobacillus kimchii TaxID=746691 RepID=UPI003B02D60A